MRTYIQAPHFLQLAGALASAALILVGCKTAPKPAAAPQAMPVQVAPVTLSPVPTGDTYVSTIKSRRTANVQPQVDGNLTRIFVTSGQHVAAGQVLMQIDPLKQLAAVQQQVGSQDQANATYQYNRTDLERQRQLFQAGIISKQAFDQSQQSFQNSKGAYEATAAGTNTQKQELAYYQIRAAFAGVIGDIPVHQGDYVSPTTLLTTLDENKDLEAYIYIPTDQASRVRTGLPVQIMGTDGNVLAKTAITFLSPQVDNGIQGILAKAPVPVGSNLRNQQIVNAQVIWSTAPTSTVPVLAITRIGGQAFVFVAKPQNGGYIAHEVAVTLGETVGNSYPILSGLNPGDKVIISGLQLLAEGAPVKPLG